MNNWFLNVWDIGAFSFRFDTDVSTRDGSVQRWIDPVAYQVFHRTGPPHIFQWIDPKIVPIRCGPVWTNPPIRYAFGPICSRIDLISVPWKRGISNLGWIGCLFLSNVETIGQKCKIIDTLGFWFSWPWYFGVLYFEYREVEPPPPSPV